MNSDVGNVLLSEHKNVEKMNVPHKAFTRKNIQSWTQGLNITKELFKTYFSTDN